MEKSDRKEQRKNQFTDMRIFNVPFSLGEIPANITINTNPPSKPSKEQIINQAFKFHSQGNIQEAAKLYQYCINQGFNDYRVFSNYGVILKNKGKLEESESSLRKAIEMNPEYAMAHYNLGNTLKEHGNLGEAESSLRKSIELNPDYTDAHLNLGLILSELGKLKEAEFFTHNAIELKPDYAEAYHNLGLILRDLGNLKEAVISFKKSIRTDNSDKNVYILLSELYRYRGEIDSSNKILKDLLKNTITRKLKVHAFLGLIINSFISREFEDVETNLENINKIIIPLGKDEKDEILSGDIIGYLIFLRNIFPEIKHLKICTGDIKIPHIGDCNSLTFSNQKISLLDNSYYVEPALIRGAKAWHFANSKDNLYKKSFLEQIEKYKDLDSVLISFGTTDCHKTTGILPYSEKYAKDYLEVCKNTVHEFLNYMERHLCDLFPYRYYFGLVAPDKNYGAKKSNIDNPYILQKDIKQINLIRKFNFIMKEEVIARGAYFIDIYELTSDQKGHNNYKYICDSFEHIKPGCLQTLFDNHLYFRI